MSNVTKSVGLLNQKITTLILIRHGEKGYFKPTGEEASRPGCPEWVVKLTELGRTQSADAAAWLSRFGEAQGARRYVSDQLRARETADILAKGKWSVLSDLKERERLSDGKKESDDQVDDRLRAALSVMRPGEGGTVIAVTHGGIMLRARAILETLSQQRLREIEEGELNDCQVVVFTKKDPETGLISGELTHVMSVCPWGTEGGVWHKIG